VFTHELKFSIFFDLKYFEDLHSMKMFFEIRKQKYFEVLAMYWSLSSLLSWRITAKCGLNGTFVSIILL